MSKAENHRRWAAKNKEWLREYNRDLKNRDPALYAFRRIRSTAQQRGIHFELTVDDLREVWRTTCPVFGFELVSNNGPKQPNSLSIDRIDSSKGYIKGNIQIMSWRANKLKSDATLTELEAIVRFLKGSQ